MNTNLNRREAIARLALLMGGAVVGGEAFLRGTPLAGKLAGPAFTDADRALLDEIAETIIPATDTPGAKAAGVGAFMIKLATDCYSDQEQALFQQGLAAVDEAARKQFGKSFVDSTPAQRTALLNEWDAAQRAQPGHAFRLIKQAAILGYFTSEIGATQALRYIETPGAYRGNEPYQKGERAWYVPLNVSTMNPQAAGGGKRAL